VTRRTFVAALGVALGIPAAFFFWVGGGFDKFRSPIDVVLPSGYTGIVCVRVLESPEPTASARYEVTDAGLVTIERDVLQSHRQWRVQRQPGTLGEAQVVTSKEWMPVLTENDLDSGVAYAVFWAGTSERWHSFLSQEDKRPYCAGRF
jgi:hypothetical protein